jgi:hypothetical protein
MAQVAKGDEITPGPAAEIEDPIWRGPVTAVSSAWMF